MSDDDEIWGNKLLNAKLHHLAFASRPLSSINATHATAIVLEGDEGKGKGRGAKHTTRHFTHTIPNDTIAQRESTHWKGRMRRYTDEYGLHCHCPSISPNPCTNGCASIFAAIARPHI